MNRREILFRGKRVDNGEWVEGNLTINEAAKAHRIVVGFGLTGDMEGECHVCFGEFHLVDPSTIGQFTGLTDSKGNKVFEGDIVKGGIYTAYEIKWDSYRAEFNTGAAGLSVSEVIGNIHDTHLTQQP